MAWEKENEQFDVLNNLTVAQKTVKILLRNSICDISAASATAGLLN